MAWLTYLVVGVLAVVFLVAWNIVWDWVIQRLKRRREEQSRG